MQFANSENTVFDEFYESFPTLTTTQIRTLLGAFLFSGEEVFKKIKVLSGGEKARCMMARIMLEKPNFILLDEPTNHLDLESITALNNGLIKSTAEMIFVSHDHQFIQTIANRIIVLTENGIIDKRMTYDEYLEQQKLGK